MQRWDLLQEYFAVSRRKARLEQMDKTRLHVGDFVLSITGVEVRTERLFFAETLFCTEDTLTATKPPEFSFWL